MSKNDIELKGKDYEEYFYNKLLKGQETFDLIVANIRQGRLQPTAAGKLGRDSKAENPPPSALTQAQQGKA